MLQSTTPNWTLVTNDFQEPTSCKELLALLIPAVPTGNEQSIISLSWKKKQFYEKENLLLFLTYAKEKLADMPTIDKDYFKVVLRMMRLYREIEDDESAYAVAKEKELISFIQTSLYFQNWDIQTKTVALSYLVSKYKIRSFEKLDHDIFHKVKLSTEWSQSAESLLTHRELLSLYLWYMRMYGKLMGKEELEEHLMGIATYINNHFLDLFHQEAAVEYAQWVHMFSQLPINKAIIHVHRAQSVHLLELTGVHHHKGLDDYILEVKELLANGDAIFLHRYEQLIGKLLSYIPFYEKISTRFQLRYFEQIMSSFLYAEDGQTELIQSYLIPLLKFNFGSFMNMLFKYKKMDLIEVLLCNWFSTEDHEYLNETYEMEHLYKLFGKG